MQYPNYFTTTLQMRDTSTLSLELSLLSYIRPSTSYTNENSSNISCLKIEIKSDSIFLERQLN